MGKSSISQQAIVDERRVTGSHKIQVLTFHQRFSVGDNLPVHRDVPNRKRLAMGNLSTMNPIFPLVNSQNHGKSPCLMGKLTINGHFQ
jgi:hypothetical protein